MKKSPFPSSDQEIKIPTPVYAIWKLARNEIIARALPELPSEMLKILRISDEQIKKIRQKKTVPQDISVRLIKEAQIRKDLQNILLLTASQSIQTNFDDSEEAKSWELVLGILMLAAEQDFNHPWLEAQALQTELLISQDKTQQKQIELAFDLLLLADRIKIFKESLQTQFFEKLSQLSSTLDNEVKDWEQYERLNSRLLTILKERRQFIQKGRTLRKMLDKGVAGETLTKQDPDIFSGTGAHFLKRVDQNWQKYVDSLKAAAFQALPFPFDGEKIRLRLSHTEPPIPQSDLELMLEELEDVAAHRLPQKDSQLLNNILPALQGEKPFDRESYEEAEDQESSRSYSNKFIRKLATGQFKIAENNEENTDSAETIEEKAMSDTGEEARIPVKEPVRREEDAANERFANEGTPDLEKPQYEEEIEQVPTEETPIENLEVDEAAREKEEDCLEESQEDGFALLEDSFSAPPQPEPEETRGSPQSMSLEEACILSEKLTHQEEKPAPPREVFPQSMDPLERKFLNKKRTLNNLDNNGLTMDGESNPGSSFSYLNERLTEKKSPISGGEGSSRSEREINMDDSIREFILRIAEKQQQSSPPAALERSQWQKLLEDNELEAFTWLAYALGNNSPYPAWLAKLLYLGIQYLPGQDELNPQLLDLIKKAIDHNEELDEECNLLLAAGVLKPALMIQNEDMRTIISLLAGKLSHYGLTPFFNDLENFISRRIPVDQHIFTGQSEARLMELRREKLQQETEAFLYRIRNSKTPYQPASMLRKILYAPTGFLGRVLEQCASGNATDLDSFLASYGDERAMEKIIDSTPLPHRTRVIQASSRKRLLSEVRQAMKIIEDWLDYSKQCSRPTDRSYSNEMFIELFEKLSIDMERLESVPEGKILATQLEELSACPKKPLSARAGDPLNFLHLWQLRIPFFDPRKSSGIDIARFMETISQNRHHDKEFIASSLVTHLGIGQLKEYGDFLVANPEYGEMEPDMGAISDNILPSHGHDILNYGKSFHDVWEKIFREKIEEVNSDIVAAEFRGILHTHQPARFLDQLNRIVQDVEENEDLASGVASLEKIRRDLKEMDRKETSQLEEKIQLLEERQDQPEEYRQRLAIVKSKYLQESKLNLAWNELAEITDHLASGEPLGAMLKDVAPQDNIAHKFYELLEAGSIKSDSREDRDLWITADNRIQGKLYNGNLGDGRVKAIAELLRWLGFTLDKRQQPKVELSLSGPNFWCVISMKMEISGPLPQWSSRKSRHIVAFGWNVRPDGIDQLLNANFMDNSDDCKTIICFNRLDFEARKRLMNLCVLRKIAPLVVDENLFNFLSSFENPARKETLFRVCLAGAGIIPYVDVGGAVPKEMFFGRDDDIRALQDPVGPCIVYGGRQLGKSALLQQIHNNPKAGVKTLLHSMSNSESSLLEAIRRECEQAGIINPGTQKKNLTAGIKKWLDDNRDWRILMLLDECDRALDMDREEDFAEVSILRDLMADTERRFKVVITGLHSVQRFSQITNQPFLHFGEPLCIGPLSSEAAFNLMTVPMSLLGVEFANNQLVQIALNHCSYQSKLIQIFCMELLKGLSNRRKVPFETIDEEGIQKIYGSNNLKKKIIECFDMTLNLDDRYLVIGYVLAINHHTGMDLRRLLEELRYYWPAAFGDETGLGTGEMLNTLRSLLHEMEGLGLVTRLDNEYMLRTPNVIDLLGGEDQILTKLDPFLHRPYKPKISLDDLRLRGLEGLVASQFNLLAEKSNMLYWISGNMALGIDQIDQLLDKMVEEENKNNPRHKLKLVKLTGATQHEMFQMLRKKYEALEGGMICWLSGSEFPFTAAFMDIAQKWLASLRTGRKYVKIICLIDPVTLHDFIRTRYDEKYSSAHIQLLPWSQDGLVQYCKENALPGKDPARIMVESGGWHKLMERYFRRGAGEKPLTAGDFWNGDQKVLQRLISFIDTQLDGQLCKNTFEDDATAMFDMLESGFVKDAKDMLDWLNTMRSLFILRDKDKSIILDPVARDAILEAGA